MKKAPYIVIDGLDGCGKGTQLSLLFDRLEKEKRNAVFTREPGGAPLSEEIRDLFKSDLGSKASALTQFLLMWASRRNYLEEIVWPALDDGAVVFSDRGDSSTLSYQIYAKKAPELESEFWRMRQLVFGDRSPDIYIILDVSPIVAYTRTRSDATRGKLSHFDAESLEFYGRVRQGFVAFREKIPSNVVFVDGGKSPEVIHKEIYEIVSKTCGW